jgi:hypothetical protein
MVNILANIIGVNILTSTISSGVTWYVRPAGAIYGTGDGTSYGNAWSGFSAIDTLSINAGDVVYIAGTHNETLTAAKIVNGVSYTSLFADPGVISGENVRNIGAVCTGKSNVIFNGITFTAAIVSCLHVETSTNIITNSCTFSGSGNQGIQHLGVTTAIHNNPTCSNNIDDGISVHDFGVITVNGGTFNSNDQNINIVGNALLTINGTPTFTGVSTYDLYVVNGTTLNSTVITMNGGTARNVKVDTNGKLVINNTTITGLCDVATAVGAATLDANNSLISQLTIKTDGIATLTNCRTSITGTIAGNLKLSKSVLLGALATTGSAIIEGEYSLFNANGSTAHIVDGNTGSLIKFKYCVFKGMGSVQFGINLRTGVSLSSYVNNCVFFGSALVGRGLFSQIDVVTNNNIFKDLSIGYFRSAGTSILNNCCFNNCTTPKSGTVTSNNEQTGNPNFVSVGSDDYNLDAGSSCIGTGLTLGAGFEVAIDTASWGDASNVPIVTIGEQEGAWNIGVYI